MLSVIEPVVPLADRIFLGWIEIAVIIAPASVGQNTPYHQFLFICLNHEVSTLFKWTPHASRHSIEKGAEKIAFTRHL
ncbi:hypothetical protein GCM10011491_46600 [Brucella endophytica]|uniref:Uncharacterized protein n=1 Tax=Brucella endophytica TaxID=1963359 RepID=A0A916WM66_9HYPH|nr:hypothetical protein GCM10011491_46600 [Brucella endophytica]